MAAANLPHSPYFANFEIYTAEDVKGDLCRTREMELHCMLTQWQCRPTMVLVKSGSAGCGSANGKKWEINCGRKVRGNG